MRHQDFSNEKHMFLVHNSLILEFSVAYFLPQKIESLKMIFTNNNIFVESQDSATLCSLKMCMFYRKCRLKSVSLS